MKRVIQVVLMALVVVAVMAPASAADKVTVGDFLTQIAQAKQLPATSGSAALQSLRGAGVALPTLDVNATLTEGTVAQIASSLGLNVTSSNPSAPFSQSQMSAFVSTFGSEIGGIRTPNPQPNKPPFDPENKGLKKGHHKTPTEPM